MRPAHGGRCSSCKGVAAVLDLQEGAGVLREVGRPEAGDPLFLPDVTDQDPRNACRNFPEDIGNPLLFGVAGDESDASDLGDLLRGPLGVAAGDQDGRRRVFPDRPTDELAGLAVRSAGDRAGVDDIAVRRLLERDEGDPAATSASAIPADSHWLTLQPSVATATLTISASPVQSIPVVNEPFPLRFLSGI